MRRRGHSILSRSLLSSRVCGWHIIREMTVNAIERLGAYLAAQGAAAADARRQAIGVLAGIAER